MALMVFTRDLMHENQVLRGLLKSLGGFIGDGAGGILTKLGWDMNDFNDMVNKAETDTAWESYQRHKRDKSEPGPSGAASSSKRPAEDSDPYGLRPKRSRAAETNGESSRSNDNFPLLVPLNPAVSSMGSNGLYPPNRTHDAGLLSEYSRPPTSASPMFVPPPSSPSVNQHGQYAPSPGSNMSMNFPNSYMPGMSVQSDPMSSMSMPGNNMGPMAGSSRAASGSQQLSPQAQQQQQQQQQQTEDEMEPKKNDAYKLIQCVPTDMSGKPDDDR